MNLKSLIGPSHIGPSKLIKNNLRNMVFCI